MSKAIKVMFVSEGYGRSFFGVAQVLMRLASCCRKYSIVYQMLVGKAEDVPNQDEGYVELIKPDKAFFNDKLTEFLPNVIHVNGVFQAIQCNAVKAAIQANIPVIISPHGMLEPWMWKQKGVVKHWIKRLFWLLVLKPVIKKADFVHAITPREAETLRNEFPGIPQIRIPNAIELGEFTIEQTSPKKDKYFLFLGRLHPVKGIDVLLKAFAQTKLQGYRLVIAGPDFDEKYSASLKALVDELKLSHVEFIGSVTGIKKEDLLRGAWCTVVPSFSEVIAMVNLESSACYTPTITTKAVGLNDWEEGGGVLINPEVNELVCALSKVGSWSLDKRMEMGRKSRALVEKRYSWDVVGEQWVEAYQMIVASGKGI